MFEKMNDAINRTAGQDHISPSAALSRFKPNIDAQSLIAESDEHYVRYGIRAGTFGLLLPPNKVSEVIKQIRIYPLPNTVNWLLGMINLRGNVVPVFDLALFLESTIKPNIKPMILVVDKGEDAVALQVDGAPQIVDTTRKAILSAAVPKLLGGHVRAAYVDDTQIWLDVDFEDLFESISSMILT